MFARRIVALFVVLAVAALGVWAFSGLQVGTDITEFLPSGDDAELARLSRELTRSDLNRTVTLTLEGDSAQEVAEAALSMAASLKNASEVSWVRAGPDDALQRAFYEAYFSHRRGFSGDLEFDDDALRERARELRNQLASPTGTFVRQIATADPLGLFLHQVQVLRGSQEGGFEVRHGAFVGELADDRVFAAVLLASEHSPFDGPSSRRLLDQIHEAFESAPHHDSLILEQAGVHAIAIASETTIRADVQRVSLIGTLGVIFIILLFFRSPVLLLVGGMPIAGGMVVALAVSRMVFGSIHGLTLAFGATLIGVALDYVVHLMSHHALSAHDNSAHESESNSSLPSQLRSLRAVRPGLLLGAATTVAGLAGLAWTSFPGIRQMAVFTSVGVAAALILTLVVLPPFLPSKPKPTAFHIAWLRLATQAMGAFSRRRSWLIALIVASIAVAAIGIPQLSWQDDIRRLSPMDPVLMAEDARVRDRVARMEGGRLIFSGGATMEDALQHNDLLAGALVEAVEAGELEGFRTLNVFLPSEQTQRENAARLPADLFERTMTAYAAEGFVPDGFGPFREHLETEFAPLRFEEFEDTPLALLTGAHRINTENGVAVLTFLRGVQNASALETRVNAIDGVRYFDQHLFMADAYRAFRTSTFELGFAGLLVVFLLVFIRYRRLSSSLAAFLPAALAAATTLGLFGLFGVSVNLLHVVCLLLILSMGVDYGVFMVEASRAGSRSGEPGVTLVSLMIACASTFLSFGALALSSNPALSSMGMTAALGVLLSLILAPSAYVLFGARTPPRSSE